MDTNGCASRAPLNILKTKLNYFYDHGMHRNIRKWFNDNGYRVNGKIVLRKYGVIPAHFLPLEEE
jgi:hypothetical protein